MGGSSKGDASIQAYFPPTPSSSPTKVDQGSDGFTDEEVKDALRPKPAEPWQPPSDYVECDIRDLYPGPKAVTFMGRVCNLYDVVNTPKTPRSAKGCIKLCVKDDTGAITVRLWYADRMLPLRLGSLVSVWTNHGKSIVQSVELQLIGLQSVMVRMVPCQARAHHCMLRCSQSVTEAAISCSTRTVIMGICTRSRLACERGSL